MKELHKQYLSIAGLVVAVMAATHWAINIDQTIPAWLDRILTWIADQLLYIK